MLYKYYIMPDNIAYFIIIGIYVDYNVYTSLTLSINMKILTKYNFSKTILPIMLPLYHRSKGSYMVGTGRYR